MSSHDRSPRRLSIGAMVGIVLVVLLVLAAVLFWLAQSTAPPTSPQTHGALGALVVLLTSV
jgi:hypothetical protein